MSAALRLRRAGAEVTLIDKADMGGDASSRNGGMVLSGLSGDIHGLLKDVGRERMQKYFKASLESIDCVERLVKEGNIDCYFGRSGHLQAAAKPSHFEALKRDQEFYATHLNHNTQLLHANEVRSEIASDYYYGGLIDRTSAAVHPAKYIAGLTRMADEAGADLYENVEAIQFERQGARFNIITNRGNITAAKLLIATNGHASTVFPWLRRRIIPVDSYMIATEELSPEVARALIPKNRMIFDTKNILYYFRLSPDGKRMLFGGRAKIANAPIREVAPILHKFMSGVFPQLKTYKIDYAWSGRVCFTFDRFPHIGSHEGVYYAVGYCGHGVAMATYFGKKLADMILGNGSPTIFSAKTFKTMPFYSGNPWFLPLVHLYFKVLDRLP